MTDLYLHKYIASAARSPTGDAAENALPLGLSLILHITLAGAGLLMAHYTHNAGSAADMGKDVPILVTFVQETDIKSPTPEAVKQITPKKTEEEKNEKTQIEKKQEFPMLSGTVPFPETHIVKDAVPEKKYPDKKVSQTAQTTDRMPASSPAASRKASPGQFAGAQEAHEIRYVDQVRAVIESHRIYPGTARRRKLEGMAVIQIRVNRTGHILDHHFVQSTGHHILDQAVLDMVQASDPLPAIPPEIDKTVISIKIPVGFQLK